MARTPGVTTWNMLQPQEKVEAQDGKIAPPPPRAYRVRRYDLFKWEHRFFLRNELAAHVRLAGLVPERHLECVRNVYLESGSSGLHSVSVVERDPLSLPLDLIVLRYGAVPEEILSSLLLDILSIVVQLHNAGCIHNDLDARSFNLNTVSADVKLGNFAFAHFPSYLPGAWQDGRSDERWTAPPRRFFGPGAPCPRVSPSCRILLSVCSSELSQSVALCCPQSCRAVSWLAVAARACVWSLWCTPSDVSYSARDSMA